MEGFSRFFQSAGLACMAFPPFKDSTLTNALKSFVIATIPLAIYQIWMFIQSVISIGLYFNTRVEKF